MIAHLYLYFGIVGIASVLAWLGALAMLVNYAWHARRTFFYARALALVLAGLVLAQINSIYVSRIEVDRRQDTRELRERQRRAQRSGTDMLNSKTAGLRFAEDSRDDSLDMAGVASSDKRSIYEQAADENQPDLAKTPSKTRWMEESGEEAPPGVKLLPERDEARAKRLDMLNLWMARFVLILAFLMLAVDYFLRFNRTVGTILPLPFGGRIIDSLFPKKYSVVFRAGNPGRVTGQLETIIRKGETFIYFGESRVMRTPAMARVVIPLRDLCRSAAAVLRPNALLKLQDRLQHVSSRSRFLKTGRLWPRVTALFHALFAVIVKGVKTLWRWIAAFCRWMLIPFRWLKSRWQIMLAARPIQAGRAGLVRLAPAFAWIPKLAALIWRPCRPVILRLGQYGKRLIGFVRRWVRNIRSGTIEFWPLIVLDASSEKAFDQDFIFECAWFDRYGFTVAGFNRSTALLTGMLEFIRARMLPRAAAAKTVHILWDFPTPMNPEILHPLAVFAREVNIKLIVFAADSQIAETGKWVEEVCPDEVPPHTYPSLFALVMLRVRRITVHLQPWLERQRLQIKARRERGSAQRAERAAKAAAAKAAVPEAKPKSPAKAPAMAGPAIAGPAMVEVKAKKTAEPHAPVTQSSSAQIPKPEVKIKPPSPVVLAPVPKPVVPMPKPVADVKAPAPAPIPPMTPMPTPAAIPKVKVAQPVAKEPVPTPILPRAPIVPTPVPKPVAPMPKPVADVKAPAPAPTPTPAKAPTPTLAAVLKIKVPQPAPVATARPKVKAAQPDVVASPKPMPKVKAQQTPSVMPIVKALSVPGAPPAQPAAPAEEPSQSKPPPEARAPSSPSMEVKQVDGVIKFYCPACKQKLSAKMDWQGKSIFCPACRTPVTIPTL